jgi:DNA-binding transcriptional LysR family regulator
MQIKWMEDFIALAQVRNFARAADLRHVTHPAFGRRIRALELWAGTTLIERGRSPMTLTAAGENFLETCRLVALDLENSRQELLRVASHRRSVVTIATGRTLARTLLANWLVRLQPVLRDAEVRIMTRSLTETAQMLERGEADFSLGYHHARLSFRLDARRFAHVDVTSDKLVPVSRGNAHGLAEHALDAGKAAPLVGYAASLALGQLVNDHLANNPNAPHLVRRLECDSADALHEYVVKGIGVGWLPWSMVEADCKSGRLALCGGRELEVHFEVRLYRPKRRLSPVAEDVWKSFAHR